MTRWRQKKTNFCRFSGKSDLAGKKLMYHWLPNMMIHTHAKFAPLDFMNKKMKGKRRFFYSNRTSPFPVKREFTILRRERRPRLHKTKTAIIEIKVLQLRRKHNLKKPFIRIIGLVHFWSLRPSFTTRKAYASVRMRTATQKLVKWYFLKYWSMKIHFKSN